MFGRHLICFSDVVHLFFAERNLLGAEILAGLEMALLFYWD